MKIRLEHVRAVQGYSKKGGICWRKQREWLKRHGIDPRDFVKNGVDEEVLLATGDPVAAAIVRQAHGQG